MRDESTRAKASTAAVAPAPAPATIDVGEVLERVTVREGLADLAKRLGEVRAFLDHDLSDVGRELDVVRKDALAEPDLARLSAAHLLEQHGKRIRPICVLLGAKLSGAEIDRNVVDLAVACELIHSATLLHDDVIDEGTERRGHPTSRVTYTNSASILGGDFLLVSALERVAQVMSRTGVADSTLMSSVLATIATMVSAEAVQLDLRGRFEPSRRAYLQVIEGKTASLFRWALEAPAMLSGADMGVRRVLGEVGAALGMAFQLVDDALDFEGNAEVTGKTLFADLLQGKLTWPLILALEQDQTLEQRVAALRESARESRLEPGDTVEVVRAIRDSGVLRETRSFARSKCNAALGFLEDLPSSEAREMMAAVVAATAERVR